MLQLSTIKFLSDLEKNNNKSWFETNRIIFENAKTDFQILVGHMIQGIATFDPSIGILQAKDCTFRINRDVRFSKNKSPYKNNIAAYFNPAGKKGNGAGYYLHIQPKKSFAAAGLWMPGGPDLARIRQEIDYNLDEWKSIINNPSLKKQFTAGLSSEETLVRPPKGYTEDNPAIAYLKMKSFVITKPLSDDEVLKKTFAKDIVKTFQASKPMISFLNRAIE